MILTAVGSYAYRLSDLDDVIVVPIGCLKP